jgi:RHS repeat-associated protein
VRALRLVRWPAAFINRTLTDKTSVHEVVVYDDPEDLNDDDSLAPRVEVHDDDEELVGSFSWNPTTITDGNLDVQLSALSPFVSSHFNSSLSVYGTYGEEESDVTEITAPLRTQSFHLHASYPEKAKVVSQVPGATGMQIDGTVYVLRRSNWHQIEVDDAPTQYDPNQAGYLVEQSPQSGEISLFSEVPSASVKGSWVTTYTSGANVVKRFSEDGFNEKSGSLMTPSTGNFYGSYESKWSIGCKYYTIFKPTFTRGVDAQAMVPLLELANKVSADSSAQGEFVWQPRANQFFGINLGCGLNGVGNGFVSVATQGVSYWDVLGDLSYSLGWHKMARFDSSYALRFAGSSCDYHVVYQNDRSARTQSLPEDLIGWPITLSGSTYYNTDTLYCAWDSPRLRQVAGRDLVADIEYNTEHYGGYTVKVYRRPLGSVTPPPGTLFSTGNMTLIREWEFSHAAMSSANPSAVIAHPNDEEKLFIMGKNDELYEIKANHILSNQGMGDAYAYESYLWNWMPADGSWTFSLSNGTSEKYKKDIIVDSSDTLAAVTVSESIDGQLVSTLTSATLSPFSGLMPEDWKVISAGNTITGVATFGQTASNRNIYPNTVDIDFDDIQPATHYTWNAAGLLSSASQGDWTIEGDIIDGDYKLTQKFKESAYATKWISLSADGNTVKTYSAPDGNVTSKTHASVAWSEITYGSLSNGLPGLPHIIKNSDDTGSTFTYSQPSTGVSMIVAKQGLLNGNNVTLGTMSISATSEHGGSLLQQSHAMGASTIQTGGNTFGAFTAWGAPTESTDFTTGRSTTWTYNSNFTSLATHTNALGLTTTISSYDVLGRPTNISANGITSENNFTAFSTTTTIGGSASGSLTDTRDTLGRLQSANNTWNGVTSEIAITRTATENIVTQTDLLGTHTATARKDDGSLVSSTGPTQAFGGDTGTALTIDGGLFKSKSAIAGMPGSFQETYTDAWGRVHRIEAPIPDGDGTTIGFTTIDYSDPTSSFSRIRVTDTAGHKTITESDPYNSAGAITRSGIDINGNGTLNAGDRYTESLTTVANGTIKTTLKTTDNTVVGGLREILSTSTSPATGITATSVNDGEETITVTPNFATLSSTTSSSKGWSNTSKVNNLGLTTESSLTGTGTAPAKLEPKWRADGSLEEIKFTTNGDTTNSQTHAASFNPNGTLASLIIPEKGEILGTHTIDKVNGTENLTIDNVTYVTKLDGTETTTSGDDIIGKTETLATTANGFKKTIEPAAGADTITNYNLAGAPTSKTYAAGANPSNSYDNGLLKTISLARGGNIINNYDNNGARDLSSTSWPALSSGIFTQIPAIVQGYSTDTAGRTNGISDPSGTRAISYIKGRPAAITYTTGPLKGYQLIRSRDTSGRDTGFTLKRDGAIIHSASKAPNGTSDQISALASGDVKIIPQRDASQHITGYQWGNTNGTFAITAEQTWTRGLNGRIEAATSNISGAPSFDYLIDPQNPQQSFDPKNRRLKCTTAGDTWTYTYTNGQLTRAIHPTLGDFSYSFDGIGRRTGDNFASNVLNQPTTWVNSQNKTLHIVAHPDARVWYNGTEIPNFTGAYNATIPIPGANGGWVAWNTLAIREGQGEGSGTPPISSYANPDAKAEKSGAVWVPPAIETLTYDLAGNRQTNAQWHYGWDAKNQLARARTKNLTTAPFGYDITYLYDTEGRRIQKRVTQYKNGSPVSEKIITFIWDSWDLIYERHQLPSGLTTLERSYLWGPDIANGNAGGAGGLLLIRQKQGNQTQDLYPLYDGTGHVTALTDSNKTLQAQYAYGPFGEKITATGPHANGNPWRYATKYLDEETGLYYFGKRYYDPITGQWISRELLGEEESLNLYSYCHNDSVNRVDLLGLAEVAFNGAGKITPVGKALLEMINSGKLESAARSLYQLQTSAEFTNLEASLIGKPTPKAGVAYTGADLLTMTLAAAASGGSATRSEMSQLWNMSDCGLFSGYWIDVVPKTWDSTAASNNYTSFEGITQTGVANDQAQFAISRFHLENIWTAQAVSKRAAFGVWEGGPIDFSSIYTAVSGRQSYFDEYSNWHTTKVCNGQRAMAVAFVLPWGKIFKPLKGIAKGEAAIARAANIGEAYTLFNKTHSASLPVPKGLGPNGGWLQSHHGLQQEWAVQNLEQYGYNFKLAPTITLETGKGFPHTAITNFQRVRRDLRVLDGNGKWGSSLQDELENIVSDFQGAGFNNDVIRQVLEQQYRMLEKLGVPFQQIPNF